MSKADLKTLVSEIQTNKAKAEALAEARFQSLQEDSNLGAFSKGIWEECAFPILTGRF